MPTKKPATPLADQSCATCAAWHDPGYLPTDETRRLCVWLSPGSTPPTDRPHYLWPLTEAADRCARWTARPAEKPALAPEPQADQAQAQAQARVTTAYRALVAVRHEPTHRGVQGWLRDLGLPGVDSNRLADYITVARAEFLADHTPWLPTTPDETRWFYQNRDDPGDAEQREVQEIEDEWDRTADDWADPATPVTPTSLDQIGSETTHVTHDRLIEIEVQRRIHDALDVPPSVTGADTDTQGDTP